MTSSHTRSHFSIRNVGSWTIYIHTVLTGLPNPRIFSNIVSQKWRRHLISPCFKEGCTHVLQGRLVVDTLTFLEECYRPPQRVVVNFAFSRTLVPCLVGELICVHRVIKPLNDVSIFDCKPYQTKLRGPPSFIEWQCRRQLSVNRQYGFGRTVKKKNIVSSGIRRQHRFNLSMKRFIQRGRYQPWKTLAQEREYCHTSVRRPKCYFRPSAFFYLTREKCSGTRTVAVTISTSRWQVSEGWHVECGYRAQSASSFLEQSPGGAESTVSRALERSPYWRA